MQWPSVRSVAYLCVVLVLGIGLALGAYRHRIQAAETSAAAHLRPGPVDIGFAQHMLLHHAQAVVMAQILLDERLLTDKRPSAFRTFALSLSTAQLLEIGQMRGWLSLWEAPPYPATRDMDWMLLGPAAPDADLARYLLACRQSATGIAGMATDEQLDALRTLDRDRRDRRFLELMLAHHEGGVPMARFAAANADLPAVRELAARIVHAQTKEILMIRRALTALEKG
jgi:uncharacterized protein (DUF305 family)